MLDKIKFGLVSLMGCSAGIYLGDVIYTMYRHLFNGGYPDSYSAPWYTRIVLMSIVMGFLFLMEIVGYIIVKIKMKEKDKN